MCGRFTLTLESIVISERFGVPLTDWQPRYNIAPSQLCPIVLMENHQRRLDFMHWGLIPHWSNDKMSSYKLINARIESVKSKPIFRKLFQAKRCLVPADGFFEWRKISGSKIPFRIALKNGELFAFAGLWDVWHSTAEEEIKSFTILTTEANSTLSGLHNRMPIMLKKENEGYWLNPDIPVEKLDRVLNPIPAGELIIYEVSNVVNSWKIDNLKCIQPLPS